MVKVRAKTAEGTYYSKPLNMTLEKVVSLVDDPSAATIHLMQKDGSYVIFRENILRNTIFEVYEVEG